MVRSSARGVQVNHVGVALLKSNLLGYMCRLYGYNAVMRILRIMGGISEICKDRNPPWLKLLMSRNNLMKIVSG